MDFIEREGAVSDGLTSVLPAISETGRPKPVKRAAKTRETRGQFRRIQVANSRETGWRKPVKSAPVTPAFGACESDGNGSVIGRHRPDR
jgi:hypothetical protein